MESSYFFRQTHFKKGCQPANLTLDCINFYYISYIMFNNFLTIIEMYIFDVFIVFFNTLDHQNNKCICKDSRFFSALVLKSMIESKINF